MKKVLFNFTKRIMQKKRSKEANLKEAHDTLGLVSDFYFVLTSETIPATFAKGGEWDPKTTSG